MPHGEVRFGSGSAEASDGRSVRFSVLPARKQTGSSQPDKDMNGQDKSSHKGNGRALRRLVVRTTSASHGCETMRQRTPGQSLNVDILSGRSYPIAAISIGR